MIEKFNLTTKKFDWENNNIKLPDYSKDEICFIEIDEKNIEKYNKHFSIKKSINDTRNFTENQTNYIEENLNKTNSNKKNKKFSFFGNNSGNFSIFSFNILRSPFAKNLILNDNFTKKIKKLRKTSNEIKPEIFLERNFFEKKLKKLLSFLETSSMNIFI